MEQDDLRRPIEDLDNIIAQVDETLVQDHDVDAKPLLSFVVPIKEERDTIKPLCDRIAANVPSAYDFEIVLIDDGSRDDSWTIIRRLAESSPHIRGIKFRHNAGKAAALAAGFRSVRGELVFTMDADLQDDPEEIPRFLKKIAEGFDLVNGWKRVRHDPWHKVLPSRVFNLLASALGGVWLHDHNCGFKCYRSGLVACLRLHGDLHRMIPSLAVMHGFRCAEIEVKHHPRRHGYSKYGIERFLRGLSDLLTVGFLRRFQQRPGHFFSAAAALQLGLAAVLAVTGIGAGITSPRGLICLATGGILFATANFALLVGLLAELLMRGPLNDELPVTCDTNTVTLAKLPRLASQPANSVTPISPRQAPFFGNDCPHPSAAQR